MKIFKYLLSPVLLSVFPVLFLFQHNQGEIHTNLIWQPLLISVAIGIALFFTLKLVMKNDLKAGVVASLGVFALFYYGFFYNMISTWGLADTVFPFLWIALVALGVFATLRTQNYLVIFTGVLNVFVAVLVLIQVSLIIVNRVQNPPVSVSNPRLWEKPLEKPVLAKDALLPDIYYIIPDDYARADILKKYFGYDNSIFISELKRRGFAIAEQGRSPYSKSEFNMASALNMDYLNRVKDVVGENSHNTLILRKMIEDNRAAQFLKSLGYQYTHIDSDNITFEADNPNISPLAAPDNLTYVWLRNSILLPLGGKYGFNDGAVDERFRQSVLSAFSKLQAMPAKPGPKFVLFHTLAPHDPYVFGPNGERSKFPDRSDTGHSTKEGMKYYVKQLEFVNKKLLETTDQILAHSPKPPIIIIQADEGFEVLPEVFGEKVAQDMRVKGLSAFNMPGKDQSSLPQNLNSVNSFRFLFDQYFGTKFGMLQNVSYPEADQPYVFEAMHVEGDAAPPDDPTAP